VIPSGHRLNRLNGARLPSETVQKPAKSTPGHRSRGWGSALALGLRFTPEIIKSLSAPASDTRIGTLEFKDGMPTPGTAEKRQGFREGMLKEGVEDNQVIIWPRLMDSETLLLTPNADTIYYISFVDLTKGPMVIETPPDALRTVDDMWFHWVVDFGKPGPTAARVAGT
jgi:Protein of unknown function (DUF1254)